MEQVAQQPAQAIARRTSKRWKWMILIFVVADFWGILRLVGTIRRECLDFMIPLNESHLRRILREWVQHYNCGRPHSSLGPGIPDETQKGDLRPSTKVRSIEANIPVISHSILGGLHHEYAWKAAA